MKHDFEEPRFDGWKVPETWAARVGQMDMRCRRCRRYFFARATLSDEAISLVPEESREAFLKAIEKSMRAELFWVLSYQDDDEPECEPFSP